MNHPEDENEPNPPVLALDLGQKNVGVAISDALSITIKRLDPIRRKSWKDLLKNVSALVEQFDAQTLVIGLPLSLDGSRGPAAETAQQLSLNFARSLKIPVYLQDERLTSEEARTSLSDDGYNQTEVDALIDSESAAIILRDFLNSREERLLIRPTDE
jgi:putative holliday junction resolvase